MGQILLMPAIWILFLPWIGIFSTWWVSWLFGLHWMVFWPSALTNFLVIVFADKSGSRFYDTVDVLSVWLMTYYTNNVAVLLFVTGAAIEIIYWILNFAARSYLVLFLLYVSAGFYTMYYMIWNGEAINQIINPNFKTYDSGLMWPWILDAIGLVTPEGCPMWFPGRGNDFCKNLADGVVDEQEEEEDTSDETDLEKEI